MNEISVIGCGSTILENAGVPTPIGKSRPIVKVDIQADEDNHGTISVGSADVGIGSGILLNAGDFYSIEINDLEKVFVNSSVDGGRVRYAWYV